MEVEVLYHCVLIPTATVCARDCATKGTRPTDIHQHRTLTDYCLAKEFAKVTAHYPTAVCVLSCHCGVRLRLRGQESSFKAQLTLKVQLQQRVLWQSRVKYFYAVALGDRETHLPICPSKRPQEKLGS